MYICWFYRKQDWHNKEVNHYVWPFTSYAPIWSRFDSSPVWYVYIEVAIGPCSALGVFPLHWKTSISNTGWLTSLKTSYLGRFHPLQMITYIFLNTTVGMSHLSSSSNWHYLYLAICMSNFIQFVGNHVIILLKSS